MSWFRKLIAKKHQHKDERTKEKLLLEPVTTKDTTYCCDSKYRVGSSCMQGWRTNMEDSHTHILSLPDDPAAAYFAVYDGHGGPKVAEYAGKHLHEFIIKRIEYGEGNIIEAMRNGFLELDKTMMDDKELVEELSGSTAVAVIIKGDKLYCANVGDSRAVGSIKGRDIALSRDHKPMDPQEFDRIMHAGSFVSEYRVNGSLALSRALGDYRFKNNQNLPPEDQAVTAYPDVKEITLTSDWEFIVLACDGIWDVQTNSSVVSFVRSHIAMGLDPEEICEKLMMECLAPKLDSIGLGCDNMTVVIVCLLHGESYEHLQERCRIEVINGDIIL